MVIDILLFAVEFLVCIIAITVVAAFANYVVAQHEAKKEDKDLEARWKHLIEEHNAVRTDGADPVLVHAYAHLLEIGSSTHPNHTHVGE